MLAGSNQTQIPEPTREIFMNLATWAQVAFYVAGGVAILVFVYGFWRRYRKYRKGRPAERFNQLGRRLGRAFVTILSNSTVRKRERFGGLAHTFILWGFLILFIGTCIVALDHDVLRFFDMKLLKGTFYLWFSLILDLFGLLFIAGLIMMIWRRKVMKPRALDYQRADDHGGHDKYDRSGFVTDDMIFVWLLLFIGVTGYLVEGLRISQTMPEFEKWSPVGWVIASGFSGLGTSTLVEAHLWSWWIHGIAVLVFVAYIPFSKMMHIVTDIANLTFTNPDAAKKPTEAAGAGPGLRDCHRLHLERAARLRRLHEVRALSRRLPGKRGRHDAVAPRPRPRPANICQRCPRHARAVGAEVRHELEVAGRLERQHQRRRAGHPPRDVVVVHDLHGVHGSVPGRHRTPHQHRADAPRPRRQGHDGRQPAGRPDELRRLRQLVRPVPEEARALDEGPVIQGQGRPQGTGRLPVVRRRLRLV